MNLTLRYPELTICLIFKMSREYFFAVLSDAYSGVGGRKKTFFPYFLSHNKTIQLSLCGLATPTLCIKVM